MVALQVNQLHIRPGQSLTLTDISWQDFEAILDELGELRSSLLAYDRGILEIMTPLPEHEYFKETFGDAVKEIAETLEIDYESYGSTTWREQAKATGVEPDNCFYLQNEAQVRGRIDLDLQCDPPPDLVLEIDCTSKSLDRLLIYAKLGVPEIWRYESGEIRLYELQAGQYVESIRSLTFPTLPIRELPELIEQYRLQGRRALRRGIRKWVQSHQMM